MVTARRVLGEGGAGALDPRPEWHDWIVYFEDTRSCHVLRANVEALLGWDPEQAGGPALPPDLQWVRPMLQTTVQTLPPAPAPAAPPAPVFPKAKPAPKAVAPWAKAAAPAAAVAPKAAPGPAAAAPGAPGAAAAVAGVAVPGGVDPALADRRAQLAGTKVDQPRDSQGNQRPPSIPLSRLNVCALGGWNSYSGTHRNMCVEKLDAAKRFHGPSVPGRPQSRTVEWCEWSEVAAKYPRLA